MNYVNKADIKFRGEPPLAARPSASGYDDRTIRLIELLFFAYRDFVGAPDEVLGRLGFGRAHHRVLHFVNRNPGLTVAELLGVLKITKQSLARVLKDLVAAGLVEQRTGARDRRQRLLHTTADGWRLALELAELQSGRVRSALDAAGGAAGTAAARFLFAMIDADDRDEVAALIGGAPEPESDD